MIHRNGIQLYVILTCMALWAAMGCAIAPPDNNDSKQESGNQPITDANPSNNSPPIASAGPDRTVIITEIEEIPLDGSNSQDPEGHGLTYQWYCSDDEAIFPQGNTIAQPTITLPGAGIYIIALVVSDDSQSSEASFLTITVQEPDAWVDSVLSEDLPSENRYRTIQAAISAVADGTDRLIVVDHGPYNEQVSVSRGIFLYGLLQSDNRYPIVHYTANENEAVMTLDTETRLTRLEFRCDAGPGEDSNIAAISIQGDNAQIDRCRIQDSQSDGIWITANSSTIITESLLQNTIGEGVVAESGTSVRIADSRIIQTGGSGIWAIDADQMELENNIIYHAGWHGVDIQNCNVVMVNHCSIIDFNDNNDNSEQTGLTITTSSEISATNNLIIIKNLDSLIGLTITANNAIHEPEVNYNYIFSQQSDPHYYNDSLSSQIIGTQNWPNANQPTTQDPLLVNPEGGDFSPDAGSPVIGIAENGEDCGAQGAVLSIN